MSGQGEGENGMAVDRSEAYRAANARDALAAMLPGAVAAEVLEAIRGAQVSSGQSPKIGELVKAVCRAKLKFGAVLKDREATIPGKEGKQGYKYGYATLAAAGEATDQFLAEEELNIFYTPEEGPGWFAVVTELYHSSDQFKSCRVRFDLPKELLGPQGTGKLLTYGRRYGKFCILDLAPTSEEDNDAGDLQGRFERSSSDPVMAPEELDALIRTDPLAAFAAVRKLIAAVAGCGDISEPRLKRLYAVADRERGWTREVLDATCAKLLGVAPAKIPWKAYEATVELFTKVVPAVVLKPVPVGGGPGPSPAPAAPPPQPPPPAQEPPLPWREVWNRISRDFNDLAPEALADPVHKGSIPAVLEAFGRSGWTPEQVRGILRAELKIEAEEMPKDGTHPPVYRKIAQAFRGYTPNDVSREDRQRYGWDPVPPPRHEEERHEEEPPFGDSEGDPEGEPAGDIPEAAQELQAAMEGLAGPLPGTADEAWRAIRGAVDRIKAASPEALVPVTPTDRLELFKKPGNGARSAGDVDALCRYYLGVRVESLPAVVFAPVVRLLQAFPVRQPGREEALGRLPESPAKMKPTELREIVIKLAQDGLIQEDEVPRSGENGKATKEDLLRALEIVRERALTEAGHA